MGILSYVGVSQFFPTNSIFQLIGILVLTPAFFFFVILVHEMGHAIAAWSLKYRVHFIAIGNVGFNPERREFMEVKDYSKNEIAGFVQYSPQWPLNGRWGDRVVSFCGPLATITIGLLFLLLHEKIGYRIEQTPQIYSCGTNKIGYYVCSPSENLYAKSIPHTGFMLLAIVCFFDALVNLLPLKFGSSKSDGRNIFDSFFKPLWTSEVWLATRLNAAFNYNQVSISDAEWRDVRKESLNLTTKDETLRSYLRYVAWLKTDPEACVAAIESGQKDIGEEDEHLRRQYIVSRIILGRFGKDLDELMPPESKTDDSLHCFAKALLNHATGNQVEAVKTVEAARHSYVSTTGTVPEEEEAIFSAIVNKTPLPELKWEALH